MVKRSLTVSSSIDWVTSSIDQCKQQACKTLFVQVRRKVAAGCNYQISFVTEGSILLLPSSGPKSSKTPPKVKKLLLSSLRNCTMTSLSDSATWKTKCDDQFPMPFQMFRVFQKISRPACCSCLSFQKFCMSVNMLLSVNTCKIVLFTRYETLISSSVVINQTPWGYPFFVS